MKTRIFASILFASAMIIPALGQQTGSGEIDGYHLVWQDLFDAEELNPMRWDIEVNGNGGGNSELQYYTDRPENVRLGEDGKGNHCLILTARRENYAGKSFTSGRLTTKNRIAFTHGKIEASIMLPKTANGLWPAFWMMGNDFDQVGWPACGEIDILEMGNAEGIRNNTQERFFNGACHWGKGWPNASYAKSSTKNYSLQDGEYHLYTMIWDENKIKMYVDLDKMPVQNPYFSMDIPANEPENEWSPGNYFHKDCFVLFNLAVGGNFPGIWDPKLITALNDENGQEASMYVNYLRIYQKGEPGETTDFIEEGDPKEDDSVEQITSQNNDAIRYDGKCVYCPFDGIDIYNMAGSNVGHFTGNSASVDSLEPGLYLVRNSNNIKKIIVK